jgi:hypothetical protein
VKFLAQGDTAVVTVGEKTKEEEVAASVTAATETAAPVATAEAAEEK